MNQKAIESLRAAVRVSPDNVPLRQHLAAMFVELGRYEEAQAEYQEALRTDPGNTVTLLELGRVLHRLGKNEEAAARLSEAVRVRDNCAEAHREMARVLAALKQREKAQRHYNQAMNLDPTLHDADLESTIFPPEPQNQLRLTDGPAYTEMQNNVSETISDLNIPLERPFITFTGVGGMEELKEQIRLDIIYPFQHPEIYEAYGKKIGGGILLYGPPGCGKTYIARATAGECQARFIIVGIEDVLNMWMGESERRMHDIFESARNAAPAILFFDELDALAGKRSGMEHSPHYRAIVNQFLAEMDGAKGDNRNLLIIGATNSPWQVDAAFRRPGRFDKVIFVPPPDRAARVEILKIHCANKPVENIDYGKVAAQMKRFSGADIQATCEAAAEIGLRETLRTGQMRSLRTADFLQALKGITPTTDEWLGTAKNYVLYSNQNGLYDPIARYLQKGSD